MKNYEEKGNKVLRVGFDARMVYYRQAGIGQYILNLLRELAPLQNTADFELIIYQSRKSGQLPAEWLDLPGQTLQSRKLWTPPHHKWEQKALPVELARGGLDVFHSPDFIPPFIRPTLRLKPPGIGKIGAVITIHDLAFLRFPHLLTAESASYYGQVKKAAISAERVIAVSNSTARDIEQELGTSPEKIRVVYEAANPLFRVLEPDELLKLEEGEARAVAAKLREKQLNPADGFLLFVSTIEPRKNLPTLFSAYARLLVEMGQDAPRLVLAGKEGWLFEDIYRQAADLGLQERLIWTGGVDLPELLWLYNRASCFVLPSLYEGFGLPPLEALACGTPVLVANTSSLPEVVGDLGTKIEPEDVAGWAMALKNSWLERVNRKREMQERGPTWAARFSWQKAALETLAVYKEIRV